MSLKLIKEAQTIAEVGDKIDLYKDIQRVTGAKSITEVAALMENDEFGITADQIHDQIVSHLASQNGINPRAMTSRQFSQLAKLFRTELEDHYDEVYPNGQWARLTADAWKLHNAPQQSMPEENEEYDRDEDDEPRLAWGQRDYEMDSEMHPSDGYLKYRAGGGKLSRDQWGFDNDQRNPWDRDSADGAEEEEVSTASLLAKCARVVKSIKTRDQYDAARKYADLVFKKVNDEIRQKKGFGGFQDSINLLRAIKSDLHSAFNRVSAQENEEQGWPSDEGRESGENYDDISSDELGGQDRFRGEMGDDEWDDLNAEINQPWGDEQQGDPAMDDEFADPESRAFENEEKNVGKQTDTQNMSQEQLGWYDAQKHGAKPRYPNDTEYMTGFDRALKISKAHPQKHGAENEELGSKSLLKSLLSQRKEVSQKASEAMKKYEAEGAKAFHEIRMKHEKSPYSQDKQGEEHAAWSKGWKKAASEHYAPEEVDPKAKAKAKAKSKVKPKR